MIGAFARKLASRERVLAYEETGSHAYTVQARGSGGDTVSQHADAPPEAFVERIQHDGGDVFFAPLVETLRNVLRGRREAPAAEDEDRTRPAASHNE